MRQLFFPKNSAPTQASVGSTLLWWLVWVLWLPLFVQPALTLIQSHPGPLRLLVSFAGAALFFALYLSTTWRCAQFLASPTPRVLPPPAALWAPITVMLALSVGLVLLTGSASGWGSLIIYMSTCAAGWLPVRQAAALIGGLVAFTLIGLVPQGGIASAITPLVFIVIPGFVVVALVRAIDLTQQLRVARDALTRSAAVTEERLRIARDLHDLLSHTLSLIALKSELAGRLLNAAPERAATEIRDVEGVARHALQEVREAVAAYRQPTLASELNAAREILAAAGIEYSSVVRGVSAALPPATEAALSWVVREGVTNVIRHSQAHHCAIAVEQRADQITVTITDDGRGNLLPGATTAPAQSAPPTWRSPAAVGEGRAGSGLAGLAERIAALGGHSDARTRPEGGFALSVVLPLAGTPPVQPAEPATSTSQRDAAEVDDTLNRTEGAHRR